MADSAVLGEQFPAKVGAVFKDAATAREAARHLVDDDSFSGDQVRIVEPGDKSLSSKVEPETRGVARTTVKAHVTTGIVGLVAGLIVVSVLELLGVQFIEWSPSYSYGVGALFGAVLGMLVGGLITLRPDHDPLIMKVKKAARHGGWSVVVHAHDHGEERRARDSLKKMRGDVIGTL